MTEARFLEAQIDRGHRLRSDKCGLLRAARHLFAFGHRLPRGWFRMEVGYIAENMMRRAIHLS